MEDEELQFASQALRILLPLSVIVAFVCGFYFYGIIIVKLVFLQEKLTSFQKLVLTVAIFSAIYHLISLVNMMNPIHLNIWYHYNMFHILDDRVTLSFWGIIGFVHGSLLVSKKVLLSLLMLHKTLIFKSEELVKKFYKRWVPLIVLLLVGCITVASQVQKLNVYFYYVTSLSALVVCITCHAWLSRLFKKITVTDTCHRLQNRFMFFVTIQVGLESLFAVAAIGLYIANCYLQQYDPSMDAKEKGFLAQVVPLRERTSRDTSASSIFLVVHDKNRRRSSTRNNIYPH